jgi:hypothetical protein
MRLELRKLEILPAEKTFKLHLIQRVDNKPVWFLIRSKLRAAVWTTFICFVNKLMHFWQNNMSDALHSTMIGVTTSKQI